jgi:putative endonuclease
MKFFVYILYSPTLDRYYVGQTQDLEERLGRHNSGRNKSTKGGIPWTMVHFQEFSSRNEAMERERKVKNIGSRRYLEQLKDQ